VIPEPHLHTIQSLSARFRKSIWRRPYPPTWTRARATACRSLNSLADSDSLAGGWIAPALSLRAASRIRALGARAMGLLVPVGLCVSWVPRGALAIEVRAGDFAATSTSPCSSPLSTAAASDATRSCRLTEVTLRSAPRNVRAPSSSGDAILGE
jgi:hypothetical protein